MGGRPKDDLEITSAGAIEHLLKHRPSQVRKLVISNRGQRLGRLVEQAQEAGVAVEERPQDGVRALLHPYHYADFDTWLERLPERSLVVVLDHLVDPQNFGAICRSAEALGASGAIIPKDRSVDVTAGVYHASVGAVATLPVIKVVNLSTTLKRLREEGFWIVGTALTAVSTAPKEVPDFERVALILGSEYDGMSEKLIDKCDWQVKIPLTGSVPSLNVSAAAAILLYELAGRLKHTPAD